jgi:antitoxin VapB
MQTAKLFRNGRSQAVRLPKECRFSGKEVYIRKLDNVVVLIPKDKLWDSFVRSLDLFTDDFMADRNQPPVQKRKGL